MLIVPIRFTSSTRCMAWSDSCATGSNGWMIPALLISPSTQPCAVTTSATKALTRIHVGDVGDMGAEAFNRVRPGDRLRKGIRSHIDCRHRAPRCSNATTSSAHPCPHR